MQFQFFQPSGYLSNYIRNYCLMQSEPHESDMTERVIPIDGVQIMFHYKEPFAVYNPDNTVSRQPRSIISGLSNSFSDVSTSGAVGVIFVRFNTAGACNFFRFPLSEIENRSIDLSDVFYKEIRIVEELLYDQKSHEQKIKIIEDFLSSRFSPVPVYDCAVLINAIGLIRKNKGRVNTPYLAEKLSVTGKTLERKFSGYLGKTPKQFIRLIRFQQTLKDISINKDLDLTEYAYNNGYFDQSHFIKDFKAFTGLTPGEFIRKYPDCDGISEQ